MLDEREELLTEETSYQYNSVFNIYEKNNSLLLPSRFHHLQTPRWICIRWPLIGNAILAPAVASMHYALGHSRAFRNIKETQFFLYCLQHYKKPKKRMLLWWCGWADDCICSSASHLPVVPVVRNNLSMATSSAVWDVWLGSKRSSGFDVTLSFI